MISRRIRFALAAAATIAAVLPASSPAASVVTVGGGTLGVGDASATANTVTITAPLSDPVMPSGLFSIVDLAGIADPVPAACTRRSGAEVVCPTAGIVSGDVRLGPGDDSFFGMPLAGPGPLTVDGGDGADRIELTANATMFVAGGPGDDQVSLGDGQYPGGTFSGDAGNDKIFGSSWPNDLIGGEGDDRLFAEGGRDTVSGGLGNDKASGGKGKDRLRGEGGDDRLSGGRGKDRLAGGPGTDRGKGGPGDDKCTSIERGSDEC